MKKRNDDIFFKWRGTKDELEEFVWRLNGVEFKIKFTLNHEENDFIAFLDVGITKKEGRLITRAYRKPKHTQQYISWHSNHPKKLLLGVMKGLIHRAHVLFDEKQDLLDELSLLSCFHCKWIPREIGEQYVGKGMGSGNLEGRIGGCTAGS